LMTRPVANVFCCVIIFVALLLNLSYEFCIYCSGLFSLVPAVLGFVGFGAFAYLCAISRIFVEVSSMN
jgi:hypothetical protein